jgi:hypothetical protein
MRYKLILPSFKEGLGGGGRPGPVRLQSLRYAGYEGQGGLCEDSNETWCLIKDTKFLDYLRKYYIFKDFAAWGFGLVWSNT